MNDFLPRTEPVASVVSAKDRGVPAVRSVSAAVPSGDRSEAHSKRDTQLQEKSAVAANYAKLQADIADVIAQLDPPRPNGGELAERADQALVAMMPTPVVVLPMPPADQDMIEFVAQVAQSLASKAAMARAAQSRVSSALAEVATA